MQLAANYSAPLAEMVRSGQLGLSRLKCPMIPHVLARAEALLPTYVHFPLVAGSGQGDATVDDTGEAPDWAEIEALLARTGTPHVNLHLTALARRFPRIAADSRGSADAGQVAEVFARDVLPVVRRFGAERVIVENDPPLGGANLACSFLPEAIRQVVEESGCGLLLDLAHVRLAAQHLGLDPREYAAALPLERVREMHVSGIQLFRPEWGERMRAAGVSADRLARLSGRHIDHLPMTDEDWVFLEWAMAEVRSGRCAEPWVVAFEHGGAGSLIWEASTDTTALREQVPRMRVLVEG